MADSTEEGKAVARFVMSYDRTMTLGVVGGARRRSENVVKRLYTSSRQVLLEVEVTGNKQTKVHKNASERKTTISSHRQVTHPFVHSLF